MREQELWEKLNNALGHSYAVTWAEQTAIPQLDSLTVVEAIRARIDFKTIWRAVWLFLELPENQR